MSQPASALTGSVSTSRPVLSVSVKIGLAVGIIALAVGGILAGLHQYSGAIQGALFAGGGTITAWSMLRSLMHWYATRESAPNNQEAAQPTLSFLKANEIFTNSFDQHPVFYQWYSEQINQSAIFETSSNGLIIFRNTIPSPTNSYACAIAQPAHDSNPNNPKYIFYLGSCTTIGNRRAFSCTHATCHDPSLHNNLRTQLNSATFTALPNQSDVVQYAQDEIERTTNAVRILECDLVEDPELNSWIMDHMRQPVTLEFSTNGLIMFRGTRTNHCILLQHAGFEGPDNHILYYGTCTLGHNRRSINAESYTTPPDYQLTGEATSTNLSLALNNSTFHAAPYQPRSLPPAFSASTQSGNGSNATSLIPPPAPSTASLINPSSVYPAT